MIAASVPSTQSAVAPLVTDGTTRIDITGHRYGRLTALYHIKELPHSYWMCKCDCGEFKKARLSNLRSGNVRSCGCFRSESSSSRAVTHGMGGSSEYNTWRSMKKRCLNPNHKSYKDYGGRGISICERWVNSFENFYADMGPRPSGLTLERKKNNLGYFPENCIWDTPREQTQNRRSTVLNKEMVLRIYDERKIGTSVLKISKILGVSHGAVSNVLYNGGWKNVI